MRALNFILVLLQGSTAFVVLSGKKTFESSKLFATSVSDKVKRAKILNRSGQVCLDLRNDIYDFCQVWINNTYHNSCSIFRREEKI